MQHLDTDGVDGEWVGFALRRDDAALWSTICKRHAARVRKTDKKAVAKVSVTIVGEKATLDIDSFISLTTYAEGGTFPNYRELIPAKRGERVETWARVALRGDIVAQVGKALSIGGQRRTNISRWYTPEQPTSPVLVTFIADPDGTHIDCKLVLMPMFVDWSQG